MCSRVLSTLLLVCVATSVRSHSMAKTLYDQIMRKSGYNRHIRPVVSEDQQVQVQIGLTLAQIIDVDERNQIMTTNVWVMQTWTDYKLTWDPEDYDNVTQLYVPAESIWHPDIVLYNNADGKYQMTVDTKATIYHDGRVTWQPPASFKSTCNIDVTYFPFDQQTCSLEFGSWTYNLEEVEVLHVDGNDDTVEINDGINLHDFYRSVEWGVLAVPATKHYFYYAGSEKEFRKWTFTILLQRRFLFYTINLIIPLVSHAFITILVFYLPADSKEKIALCINILLSLTVFFLMLAEIIPPSSVVVPLLEKYLVFTMMLVVFSVIITVITYNVHFRSSATHNMPDWIKKLFLYWLPRILRMRRPKIENSHDVELKHIKLRFCSCLQKKEDDAHTQWIKAKMLNKAENRQNLGHYQFGSKRTQTQNELMKLSRQLDEDVMAVRSSDTNKEVRDAIEGALYVANHLKQEDEFNRIKEDWKYVALVMDRCFLWVYIILCLVGSIGIICQAPSLYDYREAIEVGNFQNSSKVDFQNSSMVTTDQGLLEKCEPSRQTSG